MGAQRVACRVGQTEKFDQLEAAMSEVKKCPDCGDDGDGGTKHMRGGWACLELQLEAKCREVEGLKQALAAAQLENEALKRVVFPDLDAREPGLTRIRDWRCGDTGTVRYAEHSTRGWRVAIAKGGALTSQAGGIDIPADVFAWLIRPMMANALNLIAPAGKETT
jgi:hypothetical protein